MCGIVGIVSDNALDYKENLKRMILSLKHRGPDGQGEYYFSQCALGHVRLSIIDIANGQQPMLSSSKTNGLIFNGEIYGYQELKKSLNIYQFKTHSDTETILALYDKYDIDLLKQLPGIFSFAIWDQNKQRLFCARDRFGEKPFYYAIGTNGEFIFASEIKAILASGLVNPVLDDESLSHYLNYLYVHPSKCIYKNIYTLPPASYLIFENHKVSIKKYWNLPILQHNLSINEAMEEFKFLLKKAVKKQMVADVPVGAFLSGGLDSSTIVALASEYTEKLTTFSFGFGDVINELPFAKIVAQKYNCNHIEMCDNESNLAELLITMQDIYDEPFADSSNIPTYLISKLASHHTKVVLTGDGGDELLGGYTSWYRPLYYMNDKKNSQYLYYIFLRILNKINSKFNMGLYNNISQRIRGFNLSKSSSICEVHQEQRRYFSNNELDKLGLKYIDFNNYIPFNMPLSNTVDDAFRMDLLDYMPGDILVKTDRASMANGLELRAPFLDVDFASFCIQLPVCLKIDEHDDKMLLRNAFADKWTKEINNRKKQGFGAPVAQWLNLESIVELKEEYLKNKNKKIFSILSYKETQKLITTDNYQTWILLVLSLWLEKHNFANIGDKKE